MVAGESTNQPWPVLTRAARCAPASSAVATHRQALRGCRCAAIRRILFPKTSYHIYYWPDEAALVVRVYAVWYGGRGEGPNL